MPRQKGQVAKDVIIAVTRSVEKEEQRLIDG
jgi:hypothetical protein